MTTKADPRLMPARDREEVNEVALFESRPGRGPRAWDEMSEIDRAIVLEAARQRRRLRAKQRAIHHQSIGRSIMR